MQSSTVVRIYKSDISLGWKKILNVELCLWSIGLTLIFRSLIEHTKIGHIYQLCEIPIEK